VSGGGEGGCCCGSEGKCCADSGQGRESYQQSQANNAARNQAAALSWGGCGAGGWAGGGGVKGGVAMYVLWRRGWATAQLLGLCTWLLNAHVQCILLLLPFAAAAVLCC
jgi:hypothetical protein